MCETDTTALQESILNYHSCWKNMLLPFSKVQQLAFLREGLEPTFWGRGRKRILVQ